MIFVSGAEPVESEHAAFERMSLLSPELGLDADRIAYERRIREEFNPAGVEAMIRASRDERPMELIRRFSAGEAATASSNPKGLGRISSKGFPRLGSTLHKPARKADFGVTVDITRAVERTLHASYLAAFLAVPNYADRERVGTDEQIWQQWIQNAYVAPDQLVDGVLGLMGMEQFWLELLQKLGLPKAAKLVKPWSGLARSLGGLAGVGAVLMIAERKA